MVETIVVGGGPAGATAALQLARHGIAVRVIERAQFPRTKACGEYLSAGTVAQLASLGVASELQALAEPIKGIRLFGAGSQAELPFRAEGWSLPRRLLDDALLRAALAAGADLIHGRALDCVAHGAGVTVRVRTPSGAETIEHGRFLIGADGTNSIVARKLHLTRAAKRNPRFALGGHYSGLRDLDGFVEMFVDGRSYFAVNPLGADRANVMLIVPQSELQRRREDVDCFVRERAEILSGGCRRFAGARLEGKRIAVGPLAHATRRPVARRTLLAGDAAGFLDPFTGQGIGFALRSGTMAAETIAGVLHEGARPAEAWRRYEGALVAEFARRDRVGKIVSTVVRMPILAKRAATLVARDPARAAGLLDAVAGIGPPRPLGLHVLFRLLA